MFFFKKIISVHYSYDFHFAYREINRFLKIFYHYFIILIFMYYNVKGRKKQKKTYIFFGHAKGY